MRRAAGAAAVVALVALVGCGGGDGAAPAATTGAHPGRPDPPAQPALASSVPPGRARFVARADAACARYRRQVAPVDRQLKRHAGAHTAAKLLVRAAAAADRTVGRIDALEPPRGDEATIAAYVASGHEAARGMRAAAVALRAGRAEVANRRWAEVQLASSRSRTIATRYGFLVCGADHPQAGRPRAGHQQR